VLVLFAQEILGLGAQGYGLLLLAAAAGGLLGSLVASRLSAALGPGPVLAGAVVGEAASNIGVGLSSQTWTAAVMILVNGFIAVVWNVITIALRQELIPDPLLGRVTSAYRVLGVGSAPLGALVGGALASAFGLRAPFIVAGVVLGAGALIGLRSVGGRAIAAARGGARAA
jgi:predicted MFS family arabinose efflux permease